MSVAGTYDTVVKSPMGDQKGTLTVVPSDDGNSFTGSMAGGMGSMDITDGTIEGEAVDAPELQRVRCHLEHDPFGTGVGHPTQPLGNSRGFGRG